MNSKSKILILKDVMIKDYLNLYNSKAIFDTPNIDKLFASGSKHERYFTTAPSTAMAYSSLISGKFPHQLGRKFYTPKTLAYEGDTIFDKATSNGLKSYMLVPADWVGFISYINSFKDTKIVYYENLSNKVRLNNKLYSSLEKKNLFLSNFIKSIDGIDDDNVFVTIHFPHVLPGFIEYGSDIAFFDELIGIVIERFNDADIAITSDHGHMNFSKGIDGYAFHLYNKAVCIPLITSWKLNSKILSRNLSHVQMSELLFSDDFQPLEYIFIDTAYRLQANRRVAVLNNEFKLIYSKIPNTYELYDLDYDYEEELNLIGDRIFNWDRGKFFSKKLFRYYPKYHLVDTMKDKLTGKIKNDTDIVNSVFVDTYIRIIWFLKYFLRPLKSYSRRYIKHFILVMKRNK